MPLGVPTANLIKQFNSSSLFQLVTELVSRHVVVTCY